MSRVVDAHMHVFRDPSWNPIRQKARPTSWINQVRWFDMDRDAAEKRYYDAVAEALI